MKSHETMGLSFHEAVATERGRQDEQWGHEHDDQKTTSAWGLVVLRFAGRLGESLEVTEDNIGIETMLKIKAAAINLGAVCGALSESIDRVTGDLSSST